MVYLEKREQSQCPKRGGSPVFNLDTSESHGSQRSRSLPTPIAAKTCACRTSHRRLFLINYHPAAIDFSSVKLRDGRCASFARRHLNKAVIPRVPIRHEYAPIAEDYLDARDAVPHQPAECPVRVVIFIGDADPAPQNFLPSVPGFRQRLAPLVPQRPRLLR